MAHRIGQKVSFEILTGKIIQKIDVQSDEIYFRVSQDEIYKMYHEQECCENVSIEDICGNVEGLLGTPILKAEVKTNKNNPKKPVLPADSCTWTFYEIATINGSVTIRWYGYSNGYYSEEVDFIKI